MMGMMGGMGGMRGGANTQDQTPASSSYLTIRPHMKAVADAVEASKDTTLVSFVIDDLADHGAIKRDSVDLMPKIYFRGEVSARAMAIQALRPNRLTLAVSVYLKDNEFAKGLNDQERARQAQGVVNQLKIFYGIDAVNGNQQQGGGMMGRPGGGMMGMGGMAGGVQGPPAGMMPPGMMPPGMPGGAGGGPPAGMMPPGMGPGAGMQGGPPQGMMPPGMRPGGQDGEEPGPGGRPGQGRQGGQANNQAPESKVTVTQKDNALTLRIDVVLTDTAYELIRADLQTKLSVIKGESEMIGAKPRVHDLARALLKHVKDRQNKFPQGAQSRKPSSDRLGVPYPPDERISWMAEMLPYLGDREYTELYDAIAHEKDWRDPANLVVATSLVSPFLNPWSTRDKWWVPYPNLPKPAPIAATHFVGIAGIGLDAAEYAKDDKSVADKIGIFGYDRVTAYEELKKPEYTIAVLQVPYSEFKAPWLAGGGSTVRGVAEETGVEPLVCESYKYKDGTIKAGTFAIMANGDVRFIPKDIKKDMFLKMCSITQAEKVDDVDEVCPVVPPPKVAPKPALPPPPAPANNEKPAGPKAPDAAKPKAELESMAVAAMNRNCAMCHTGAKPKGKHQIFLEGGTLNPDASKEKISKMLAEGKMPPPQRPRPSNEDLDALQAWLKAGK
jgi:hypothetical protein